MQRGGKLAVEQLTREREELQKRIATLETQKPFSLQPAFTATTDSKDLAQEPATNSPPHDRVDAAAAAIHGSGSLDRSSGRPQSHAAATRRHPSRDSTSTEHRPATPRVHSRARHARK